MWHKNNSFWHAFIGMIILLQSSFAFAQETVNNEVEERTIEEGRILKEKYKDKAFDYKEEAPKKKKKQENTISPTFATGMLDFMGNVFPYLLLIIVLVILINTFAGVPIPFLSKKEKEAAMPTQLDFEEDNIQDIPLNKLLKRALKNEDYALAVRYYYLKILQELQHKKYIKYDRDKTNSDYLFELEEEKMRKRFSYISYVYDYVWYGKFAIDEAKFKTIASKYNDFLDRI